MTSVYAITYYKSFEQLFNRLFLSAPLSLSLFFGFSFLLLSFKQQSRAFAFSNLTDLVTLPVKGNPAWQLRR